VAATGRSTFTAAHGVIDWVHGHATIVRPAPGPTGAPSLSNLHAVVLDISDLSDGRATIQVNLADFTGRQANLPPVPLLRHQLRAISCGPHQLRFPSHLQAHIVNGGSERNKSQGKTVARLDVRLTRRQHGIPNLEANGP
jgi:hypothetical protein